SSIASAWRTGVLGVPSQDRLCKRDGLIVKLAVDDTVDRPEFQGFLGAENATARDDFQGRLEPHDAREPLRAAGTRDDAKADFGKGENGRPVGQAVVTRERYLQPTAEGARVNRGDDRLRR